MKLYKLEIRNRDTNNLFKTKYYKTLDWLNYNVISWGRSYNVEKFEAEITWKQL